MLDRYTYVLQDMRKVDDSLRKLRKGRQGFSLFGKSAAQAVPADESEEDRVKSQMRKDVEAFTSDAAALGVATEGSEELQALQREVASATNESA